MTLQILTNIILPIFLLIGLGALLDRLMPIDLGTLARLSFYVFISAVVFVKLLDSDLDPLRSGEVIAFCVAHMFLYLALSWFVFGMKDLRQDRPVLAMGAIFYNSGNFGLPFAQLAFGSLGVSVMTMMMVVQLVANFTIGLWLVGVGKGRWQDLVESILKAPVIYIILAGLIIHNFHIPLPAPVYQSINYLANGLIPVALLTLGIQLARSKAFGHIKALSVVSVSRLVLSPLLAAGMILVWNFLSPGAPGSLAPILIAGSGLPVAVNVYILSAEYGKDPELASQSIFWTTLLSTVTLTVCLALLIKG